MQKLWCKDYLLSCLKKSELNIRKCREEHKLCPVCGINVRVICPIDITSEHSNEKCWRTKK